jgi:hypothetical protein
MSIRSYLGSQQGEPGIDAWERAFKKSIAFHMNLRLSKGIKALYYSLKPSMDRS